MNNFLYLIGRGHSIDVECCRKQMIEKGRRVNMKIEFSFDTLLALISCITGIVALFFGGSAYKSVHDLKKSFNDKKKFGDNGVDNSKKAGGDIVEYNCDTNALATLTAANFKTSLEQAYAIFEKKTDDNLYKIIEKTNQIIQEKKIELGSYTKIDWINVYFENAKTSSDEYMQSVWAKVLTQELSFPGSISYKSLDILKNMTSDDFKLFERLCSVNVDNTILTDEVNDFYKRFNLYWTNLLKLKEFNLISLEDSERTYSIEPNDHKHLIYGNRYIIFFKNDSDKKIDYKLSVYILTQFAIELSTVVTVSMLDEFIVEYAKILKSKEHDGLSVTLHKINNIIGGQIHYDRNDLLDEKKTQIDESTASRT